MLEAVSSNLISGSERRVTTAKDNRSQQVHKHLGFWLFLSFCLLKKTLFIDLLVAEPFWHTKKTSGMSFLKKHAQWQSHFHKFIVPNMQESGSIYISLVLPLNAPLNNFWHTFLSLNFYIKFVYTVLWMQKWMSSFTWDKCLLTNCDISRKDLIV